MGKFADATWKWEKSRGDLANAKTQPDRTRAWDGMKSAFDELDAAIREDLSDAGPKFDSDDEAAFERHKQWDEASPSADQLKEEEEEEPEKE